jgi:hypothetical protein
VLRGCQYLLGKRNAASPNEGETAFRVGVPREGLFGVERSVRPEQLVIEHVPVLVHELDPDCSVLELLIFGTVREDDFRITFIIHDEFLVALNSAVRHVGGKVMLVLREHQSRILQYVEGISVDVLADESVKHPEASKGPEQAEEDNRPEGARNGSWSVG